MKLIRAKRKNTFPSFYLFLSLDLPLSAVHWLECEHGCPGRVGPLGSCIQSVSATLGLFVRPSQRRPSQQQIAVKSRGLGLGECQWDARQIGPLQVPIHCRPSETTQNPGADEYNVTFRWSAKKSNPQSSSSLCADFNPCSLSSGPLWIGVCLFQGCKPLGRHERNRELFD